MSQGAKDSPALFSTFGDTLKLLRRRARLTQLELSIAVGYSEAHISRLETGQRLPEPAAVAALFVPALRLESDAEQAGRLLQLAAAAREQSMSPEASPATVMLHTVSEGSEELPPTNLPHPLDRFIGRTKEMQQATGLLATGRLLTLCGPGGVGKTRLAIELAWQTLPKFADGICLVQLAEKPNSSDLAEVLAADLDMHEAGANSVDKALLTFLSHKQMLLVLDNCEHLVSRLAPLARRLLETCPGLTLLATSREPLHVTGEQVLRVPPLQLPAPTRESEGTSESVELFMERARSAAPSLQFDSATAQRAAAICRRLDGMPLAIELAAARLSALTIDQLQQRLEESLHLSSSKDRAGSRRQQTPLGVVEWSYGFLSPAEQKLLRQLSVFSGGWTAEAALAVAGSRSKTPLLDTLSDLIDKSLVLLEKSPASDHRYRMLETVRQFSLDELRRRKEEGPLRSRHFKYFLALAEEFDLQVLGADRRAWLSRMDAEHENFKAALVFAKRSSAENWWRLVGGLGWYWHARGLVSEGLAEVKPLLLRSKKNAKRPAAFLRAKASWLAGGLYWIRGDLDKALRALKESIALGRSAGSKGRRVLAESLREAGIVATSAQKWGEAEGFLEEALVLWRRQQRPADLALALYNYGYFLEATGQADRAQELFAESLGLCRAHRLDWVASVALFGLGRIAARKGELRSARTLLEETLELSRQDEDPWGAAECLGLLGEVELMDGHSKEAARWFHECLLLNRELSDSGLQEIALHGLGKVARAARQDGQALRLMAGAALVRASGGSGPRALSQSAEREREFAMVRSSFPSHYVPPSISAEEAIRLAEALAAK